MAVVDLRTLSAAKTYTDESLLGGGAIKGANAVIAQIKRGATENEVVFEWTLADGSKQTDSIIVKNGKDGEKGKDGEQGETGVSIAGAHFNSNGKIVFELSDGSETAPISLPSASVDISPDSGNVIEQRGNGIFVPETDTSNFVEKEANKSLISDEDKAQIALNKSLIETLNGDESVVGSVAKQIAEALGKLNSLSKEIVDAVPSVADAKDNVIYLLKGEGTTYEMYSVVSLPDGSKNMASLGSTEIDLGGYLTETKAQEIYLALADVDKDTLAKIGTVTEGEVIYLSFNGSKILTLSQIESIVYKKSEVDALLDVKIDKSAVVKSLDSTKTDAEIPSAKCVFDELEGKINSEQGSVNAGKALVINEEGNVVPGDIIEDSTASGNKTWSSKKTSDELTGIETELNAKLGDKADKNAVLNSLEIKNGYTTAQIIPWNDGTHYRSFEDKSNNTYTDIVTNNGIALIARTENGIQTKSAELATTNSTLKIIQLSGSVDCNTLTEPGLYIARDGAVSALTNIPVELGSSVQIRGGFSILVTASNTEGTFFGSQMFIPYGSDLPFIRKAYYFNGQYWTDWKELATMDKFGSIPIEANRTITFSNDYTEIHVYRCGYSDIRAHIEIDAFCNITSVNGWIQDMGIVLPEGYRPYENISIPAWCNSDTEFHTPITLMIGADGILSGYIGQSHTSINRLNITVTYFK